MSAALVEALRRIASSYRQTLAGKPVRDADEVFSEVDAALAAAEAPTVAQPVAALMRSRSVTTWPHLSVDGKTHYSEWGDWLPTTYKHAKAVTDPSRNADPVCYEMQPLYAAAPPQPVPLLQTQAQTSPLGVQHHCPFCLNEFVSLTPQPVPLTGEQREEVYAKASRAMSDDPNLAWRNAIVAEVERAHGIRSKT